MKASDLKIGDLYKTSGWKGSSFIMMCIDKEGKGIVDGAIILAHSGYLTAGYMTGWSSGEEIAGFLSEHKCEKLCNICNLTKEIL